MKIRIALAVFAAALVSGTTAFAGLNVHILTGSFKTVISGKSSAVNGTWILKIDQFGKFATSKDGKVVVRGTATAADGKLAINDTSGSYACKGLQRAAVYTYTLKGKALTLKPKVELCQGRKLVFSTHPLTKIG